MHALGQLATVAAAVLPISDAAWRRDGGGSGTLPQVPVTVLGTAHCPTGSSGCGAFKLVTVLVAADACHLATGMRSSPAPQGNSHYVHAWADTRPAMTARMA